MMAGTVVDLSGSFLYRWRFRKLNPGFRARWGIPDKPLLKQMLGFGGYTTIMNLGNRLFLSSANMIAGFTHGAIGASELYSTQMPASTGFNILYRFTESSTPAVHELYGRGEKQKMATAFTRLLRLMLMMTFPLAIGTYLFNQDVVTAWVGLRMYAGGYVTIFLACYVAVSAIQGLAILFSFVVGWIRLLAVTSCLQGLANLALGYYLGKRMGLAGIVLSLLIVMCPQLFILLRRLNHFFEFNSFRMMLFILLRTLVPLGFATIAGLFVHMHVHVTRHRYGGLLVECLAFSVAYLLGAYFLVMENEDRQDTRRYLTRLGQMSVSFAGRILGSRS